MMESLTITPPIEGVDVNPEPDQLWHADTGTLREPSRRALVALVKGPYISAEKHRDLWRAVSADTQVIRSRLADLFLDLIIDDAYGVAFVRGAVLDRGTAPQVVRTLPLTFIDTILLLQLRGELVRAGGMNRVIVGKDEVFDQISAYRTTTSTDLALFKKRFSAAWTKLEKQNLVIKTSTEDRFEVSPVLRLVFSPEEIQAVSEVYERLRSAGNLTDDDAALMDSAEGLSNADDDEDE